MREPLHIIIQVSGGIVQNVLSPLPIRVTVIDYDTEAHSEADLVKVPSYYSKGDVEDACIEELTPEIGGDWLKAFYSMPCSEHLTK